MCLLGFSSRKGRMKGMINIRSRDNGDFRVSNASMAHERTIRRQERNSCPCFEQLIAKWCLSRVVCGEAGNGLVSLDATSWPRFEKDKPPPPFSSFSIDFCGSLTPFSKCAIQPNNYHPFTNVHSLTRRGRGHKPKPQNQFTKVFPREEIIQTFFKRWQMKMKWCILCIVKALEQTCFLLWISPFIHTHNW